MHHDEVKHCFGLTKVIHTINCSIAVLLVRVIKQGQLYLQLFLPSPLVEVSRVTSAVRGHGFILRS